LREPMSQPITYLHPGIAEMATAADMSGNLR
jgi:hypothetical protein